MIRLARSSLKFQILLPAVVGMILLTVVLGSYLIFSNAREVDENFSRTGEATVRILAPALVFGLTAGDRENLVSTLESAFSEPGLNAIEVKHVDNKFSVQLARNATGQTQSYSRAEIESYLDDSRSLMSFSSPVESDFIHIGAAGTHTVDQRSIVIGNVVAWFDQRPIVAQRNKAIISGLLLTLVTLLVTVIFVARLSRNVVNPLTRLPNTLEKLEGGDLDVRTEISPIDEIGRVQSGVNAMAESLATAQRTLESRVDQATRRLRETIDDLERSEGRYRNLFVNASDGVFTLNTHLRVIQANPASESLLGVPIESLVGSTILDMISVSDRTRVQGIYARQKELGEPSVFETELITTGTSSRSIEIHSRPLYTGAALTGFHGVARDVTARRRTEVAVDQARLAAESANRAKSAFLANVSHEIRSPLNGILGFLNLLDKTPLSGQQRDYITTADSSAQNLIRVVDDLVDMAKVEAGYLDFRPSDVEFGKFLEDVIAANFPAARSRNLNLTCDARMPLPRFVVTDRDRLAQLLNNLIGNAIKFTNHGSVCLNVSSVDESDSAATIRFTVTDDGPGFDVASIEKILQPFERSERAIEADVPGVGLGLSISRSLVDAMGGRIELGNRDKGGGKVCVTISFIAFNEERPAAQGTVVRAFPRDRSTASNVTLKRPPYVLVVDDSDINTRFVSELLAHHGIKSKTADDGEQAIQHCERERFDLIFMDVQMPRMNGLVASNKVRSLLGAQCPPIVALTAEVTPTSRETLEQEGFDEVLFKPAGERDLMQCLSRLTGHMVEFQTVTVTPEQTADVDEAILDRNRGMQLAGENFALWRENLNLLLDECFRNQHLFEPDLSSDVQRAALSAFAHRISGSSAYVGARNLEHFAQLVERSCEYPEEKLTIEACREFLQSLESLRSEAERLDLLDRSSSIAHLPAGPATG